MKSRSLKTKARKSLVFLNEDLVLNKILGSTEVENQVIIFRLNYKFIA